MDPKQIEDGVGFLSKAGGIIATVVAVIAGMAVGEYRLRQTEKGVKSLKRGLYDENGRPIYIMRDDCVKNTHDCQAAFCRKIDDLKSSIQASDERREAHEIKTHEILLGMAEKLGRVTQQG